MAVSTINRMMTPPAAPRGFVTMNLRIAGQARVPAQRLPAVTAVSCGVVRDIGPSRITWAISTSLALTGPVGAVADAGGHREGLLLVRVQAGGAGGQGHPQDPSPTRLLLSHGQRRGPEAHERHDRQENHADRESSHRRFSFQGGSRVPFLDRAMGSR